MLIFVTCAQARDVEAEAGSGPFSAEAEARKFYHFRIGLEE